jgi:hypothetical protein
LSLVFHRAKVRYVLAVPREQHRLELEIPAAAAREFCLLALETVGFQITAEEAWRLAGKLPLKLTSSSWPVQVEITLYAPSEDTTTLDVVGNIGGLGPIQERHLKNRLSELLAVIQQEAGVEVAGPEEAAPATSAQSVAKDGVVGRVGKKALEEIIRTCRPGEQPEFIIGSGMGGALAAFSDRCLIVKKGGMTSFMAGSTGGGRTTTFHYVDVMAVEYNSGWVNGTLEILTPSHDAGRASDYWKVSSGSGSGSSGWELPNVLPLPKREYEIARPHIDRLRQLIADAKRPQAPAAQAAPPATDLASQLTRLRELHADGALDDDEFQAAKRGVLENFSQAE